MSFHQLEFRPKYVENAESRLPPLTLPVMFENENVALAIYEKDRYSFNLPEKIGAQIDFGSLSPAMIFGSNGRGWSRVPDDGDELLYIVVEPATPTDAADSQMQLGSTANGSDNDRPAVRT